MTTDGGTPLAYTPGANNRTQSDGAFDYQYDAEGNRINRSPVATGETTEYEWDHRNRLTKIIDKDATGAVIKTVEYIYDPLNRRIAKSIDADGAGSESAEATFFINDGDRAAREGAGDHVVLQLDGSGNITNRYLQGAAIDQVLADEDATSEVLWPLADNLGSIRDLATHDSSTGDTVVAYHIRYGAFGQIDSIRDASDSPVSALDAPLRFGFTGREWDAESGLYYYRARIYDAALGQFLSEDPIGFDAGDSNLRRYVGNKSTFATDPSGLAETLSEWLWGWISPISPADAVETVYAYDNAPDSGRLNRQEQTRETSGVSLESYLDGRLKNQSGIGGNHVHSGLGDVKTVAKNSYQVNAGLLASAAGVSRVGSVSLQSGQRILAKIDDAELPSLTYGNELVATAKPSQRVPAIAHTYVNLGNHVPKGTWPNKHPYIPGKEVLPGNHVDLFNQSVIVKVNTSRGAKLVRWTKVGSGKSAVYHRFEPHSAGEYHWTGSTHGKDSKGHRVGIDIGNVPESIRG